MRMNNYCIISTGSKQESIISAAINISNFLDTAKTKKQSVLFLSSGGSVLEILNNIPKENLGEFLTMGMLDERYSLLDSVNNFAQFTKLEFYANCLTSAVKFVDSRIQTNETSEQLCSRLNLAFHDWKVNNPKGLILLTLGLGSDGHTEGIMPYPEAPEFFKKTFIEAPEYFVSYNAGDKNPYPLRVTATFKIVLESELLILLANGIEKKPALIKALDANFDLATTPADIITKAKNAFIYTDQTL